MKLGEDIKALFNKSEQGSKKRGLLWIIISCLIITGVILSIVLPLNIKKTYTITYNLDGGNNSSLNYDSYSSNEEINLKNAYKKGYAFDGWYIDSDYKTIFSSKYLTSDLVLYRKFSLISYVITYELDGGLNDEANPKTYTVETDTFTFIPAIKDGYIFFGFYSDITYLNKVDKIVKGTTGNMTLYAKYKKALYTISFETFGGTTIDDVTVEIEEKLIKPADPVKEGCIFNGWYLDQEFINLYDFNTPVESDFTLYAKFVEVNYTITWLNDDGTVIDTTTVAINTMPTHDAPTKESTLMYKYSFTGWSPELAIATKNTSYKAVYKEELNTYTVYFNSNGGSNVESQNISYGNTVTEPAEPIYNGYIFGLWFIDEALTNLYDFNTPITSDITLYAKWNVGLYTIKWLDENEDLIDITLVEANEMPTHNNPTKASTEIFHYEFIGWSPRIVIVTANTTYIAEFKEVINEYTVTYVTLGGTEIGSETVSYGIAFTKPTDPIKAGYVFKGWYLDPAFQNEYDFSYGATKDITLYAKWS